MAENIKNSQFADRKSRIINSKNNSENSIKIKKIRTETIIISFIVGTIASLLASYIYENWLK